ncbi:uncharacterized protein LOC133742774 [Rosa rugosa]|uniref:uncharacterized protein LOC133742774 n=1 Tax=Rosa rugosa TaxID=74645 RepID=UPI002B4004C5|nr:uncharacterized protein LOC133742774 [Rosa rugosa]
MRSNGSLPISSSSEHWEQHQGGSNKEEDFSHVPLDSRDRSGPIHSTLGEALRAKNPSGTVTTLRGSRGSLTFSPPFDLNSSELRLPYPQVKRAQDQKKRKETQKQEFIELFKSVNINIPLLNAIKQVPAYAKCLKDMCTNKRKFVENEDIYLSEQVSAVLQRRLTPKLSDPGSFTIPCTIGSRNFDHALLDLGASINLMPYDLYKTLSLEPIKPLKIKLKMADRRIKYPRGVVEDVLVKVDELYVPTDFVVLDMDSPSCDDDDDELPIIFGRAFMATVGVKIDVQKGLLTMTVFDTTIGFRIFDAMRSPLYHLDECFRIDVMDDIVGKNFIEHSYTDYMETCIAQGGSEFESKEHVEAIAHLEALTPYLPRRVPPVLPLPPSTTPPIPSYETPPDLELKTLPSTLRYAFLGEESTLPVIISSKLSKVEED